MINDEDEYPELHRNIRLVPRDPKLAVDPAVCAWLDEVVKKVQPVVDRAMELATYDIVAYGHTLKTIEEYVQEAMR